MIWLIGNRGMLGREIEARLAASGRLFRASDLEVDITDPEALRRFAEPLPLAWIVNASAYTAVDRAEDEAEAAFRINAQGVENIAWVAAEKGARLIHISTDYVFDGGKNGAYVETDPPRPTGVYGASKYEGERRLAQTGASSFLIRTAWLYGPGGANFVSTMLRLFRERDEVRVVSDQWGSPTLAGDLAEAVLAVIAADSRAYGIYHFTNEGRTNWFAFAGEIYRLARQRRLVDRDVCLVPIRTEDYPTRARRPANSYLSKEKIRRVFHLWIRPWQEALSEYLAGLEPPGPGGALSPPGGRGEARE